MWQSTIILLYLAWCALLGLKKQVSKAYNECSVKYFVLLFRGHGWSHEQFGHHRGVINKITSLPNKCPIFTIWLLSAKCNVACYCSFGFSIREICYQDGGRRWSWHSLSSKVFGNQTATCLGSVCCLSWAFCWGVHLVHGGWLSVCVPSIPKCTLVHSAPQGKWTSVHLGHKGRL